MGRIDEIKSAANLLTTQLDHIGNYRTEWESVLKPRLLENLNFLRQNVLPPFFYVVEQSDGKYRESVFLVMDDIDTGIIGGDGSVSYLIKGGYLQFTQTFNGKIAVVVNYPSIKGITTVKPGEVINTSSPDIFTVDMIDNFVEGFLGKMNNWVAGQGSINEPIGFKQLTRPTE